MKKVWIVYNDCPEILGGMQVLSVHASKAGAEKAVRLLLKKDEYYYQYVKVEEWRVRK